MPRNDSDPDDDALTLSIASWPMHGVAWVDDNDTPLDPTDDFITYLPGPDFNGTDEFTYQVDDGYFGTDTATVTVTVNSVNDPPEAVDDSYVTDEDTTLEGASVLINDDDSQSGAPGENNLPLTPQLVTGPAHAAFFTFHADGTFTYTPAGDYNGTDSFTYTATDSLNAVSNVATATITINPVNDKPTGDDQTISAVEDTPVDFTLTGSDVETPPGELIFTIITPPLHGTVTIEGANVIYTPDANYNGPDSFQFTVTDTGDSHFGDSLTSDPATVIVNVTPVNDPPVALDDSAVNTWNVLTTIDVLANDSDPDGDPLTVVSVTEPSHGAVYINSGATSVTYRSLEGFTGIDQFQYTITDGNGGYDTATVSVTVGQPQLLDGEPTAGDNAKLTDEQLGPVVAEAISHLHAAGFNVTGLNQATFVITELHGVLLGVTYQTTVWLDQNAAGHGWYFGSEWWSGEW